MGAGKTVFSMSPLPRSGWDNARTPPPFKFGESESRAILCPISGGSAREVASLG